MRVEGDPEVQQAVRFGLFHVLQAGARAERRPISAKGLTGPGYDGHAFWDTEMFVLPVLTYTQPGAVRRRAAAGGTPRSTSARERARTLEPARAPPSRGGPSRGRSARRTGRPAPPRSTSPPTSPTRCARYVDWPPATRSFEREIGLELLVETARLWRSLGHHDRHGQFHIDGVTGPDEYTAVKNDNVYTNLMAQRNLLTAADVRDALPGPGGSTSASATRRPPPGGTPRTAMHVPYDDELDVHQQVEGFTRLQEWDFAHTPPEKYPLLLHYPYFDLYRKQVVKQADLVLAMHWRGDAFTAEQKAAQLRSTTSGAPCATRRCRPAPRRCSPPRWATSELAHDYLREAALMDLHDLNENTRDGVHMASLAGAWIALVAGFGGLRDHDGELSFAPRLLQPAQPAGVLAASGGGCGCGWTSGRTRRRTRCATAGRTPCVELRHHGEALRVTCDAAGHRAGPARPTPPARRRSSRRAGRRCCTCRDEQ